MNISSVISKGSKILKKNLILNSHLDSEILMAKTINKDRKHVLLNPNNFLNKNNLNYFYHLIKKRSLGYPVAYLINKKFFGIQSFLFHRIL